MLSLHLSFLMLQLFGCYERLAKDGSFKIHDRNLQRLLIEIFKVKMKLALEIMNEAFDSIESPYPLRN